MNTDSGRVAIVMPPRMSTMASMDDAHSKEVCDHTGTLTLTLTITLTLTLTLTITLTLTTRWPHCSCER